MHAHGNTASKDTNARFDGLFDALTAVLSSTNIVTHEITPKLCHKREMEEKRLFSHQITGFAAIYTRRCFAHTCQWQNHNSPAGLEAN